MVPCWRVLLLLLGQSEGYSAYAVWLKLWGVDTAPVPCYN